MNRLIVSAIGVLLTFCWIIYTAPDQREKTEKLENEPIKKISKSGSTSLNKIKQPIAAKNRDQLSLNKETSLLFSNTQKR